MCDEQWGGAVGFNFSAQEKLGEKERHTHTLRALRAHTQSPPCTHPLWQEHWYLPLSSPFASLNLSFFISEERIGHG